jgi:hypothetical protein
MLKEALTARLPLIVCTTRDTLNVKRIILHLSGAGSFNGAFSIEIGSVGQDYAEFARQNLDEEKTHVIVNPDDPVPAAFNAGEVPVPAQLIRRLLREEFHVKPAMVVELWSSIGGLTLKEIDDLCRLTQSQWGELNPETVRSVRQTVTQVVPGVQVVDTALEHYFQNDDVVEWLEKAGVFLRREQDDWRLRPRGLLMAGLPGTGKTLSSKYIAAQLSMTLFRLDVGALQSKYVGESEQNLQRALTVISQNEPCVMLIDEVEKLFYGSDDSGVTANLLATLLWWLQEHRNRVLTIMTTNDNEKLPRELVRPGRIDAQITFGPLLGEELNAYLHGLLESLGVTSAVTAHWEGIGESMPHAQVTATVIDMVRDYLLENEDGDGDSIQGTASTGK